MKFREETIRVGDLLRNLMNGGRRVEIRSAGPGNELIAAGLPAADSFSDEMLYWEVRLWYVSDEGAIVIRV